MKYSLLAAALVTLIFTGCDQLRQKDARRRKTGTISPSLWEKREGQVSDAEIEAAQKADAECSYKKVRVKRLPPPKPEYDVSGKKVD